MRDKRSRQILFRRFNRYTGIGVVVTDMCCFGSSSSTLLLHRLA